MRQKFFGLVALGILALVFVTGIGSAAVLELTPISVPSSVSENVGTFTGTYNLTYTGTQSSANVTFTGTSNFGSVTIPTTSINPTESKTVTATFLLPSGHAGQTMSGTLNASGTGGSSASTNFSVLVTAVSTTSIPPEVTDCTSIGNPGNIDVRNIDFTNNGIVSAHKEFGSDDEWFPLENVDVQIDVRNRGNDNKDRVNNIEVDWGIWDTDANQWVIEPIDEKDFDLKEGKTDTLTVSFTLDEKDLDVNLDELTDGDNYLFYAIATGEVDDGNDTTTCAFDSQQASVIVESDFVVLDNIQMPETVQCGATVDVTADVWNIGDNDQDEVSVYTTNDNLNIVNNVDAGDINAFDKQKISFSFKVPNNAEEKIYPIEFQVYDEDNEVYQNDFNDDLSEFSLPLTISGNCEAGAGAGDVLVSANIVSGGREGQELVVKATVTNTGDSAKTYSLNVAGFEDWASSFSLDQNALVLDKGQSKDVSVTLDVNDDAAGSKTFFLEFLSDGGLVRQPVTVSVAESGGAGITGFITSDNWYLWGIGLLNVLLVVVIIIVAVRIARKR